MNIRTATSDDADAIRRIYEPYVKHTAISFEYEVPTVKEFENRIENTLKKFPYLVAEENGKIVGYAYAGTFRTRAAYIHSAELSVYVNRDFRQRGIGRNLYTELIKILVRQNIYTVHACITNADVPDEYQNNDSEKFHASMGFTFAGMHRRVGYKFGKWYNVVWMDKEIAEKPKTAEDFIPFPELK